MISRQQAFSLYQDNNNKEVHLSLEEAVKSIIEKIHHIPSTPTATTYNKIDKLNLDLLWREQQWDNFGKNKVKEMKTKPDPDFILDKHSILRKAVELKYTV